MTKRKISIDERALLAAIKAAPDDDTARLVYADYLDENGRPNRAEFIRQQIEAERHPVGSPEWSAAKDAADELYYQHGTNGFPNGRKKLSFLWIIMTKE